MNKDNALIFGFNEYSFEIAKSISSQYKSVVFFVLDDEGIKKASQESYKVNLFELDDDWSEISKNFDISVSDIFCTLNDDAENVFLTLSLRSEFEDVKIISLARSRENVSKLELAGATKVMPILDTATTVLVDILENPIANKILNDILYSESLLKLIEIKITSNSTCIGKKTSEIEWSQTFGIIPIAFYTKEHKVSYIYDNKVQEHDISEDDVFIVVGYEQDLINFKNTIQKA
jgi:voltage-gated potassium channel